MLHINPGFDVATFQNTGTRSVFYGRATLGQEFPTAITIYDLNELLRVLSSFAEGEAILDCHENEMVIRNEDSSKRIRFAYGNPKLINKQILEGKNIELDDFYETMTVPDDQLQFVLKQARSLGLCDIVFKSNGDKIEISAGDINKKKMDIVTLTTSSTRSNTSGSEWRFGFSIDNITRLLRGEYDVSFKVMPNKNVIGQFLHRSVRLKYIIGAQNDTCVIS
jgi:hypothetical protein